MEGLLKRNKRIGNALSACLHELAIALEKMCLIWWDVFIIYSLNIQLKCNKKLEIQDVEKRTRVATGNNF